MIRVCLVVRVIPVSVQTEVSFTTDYPTNDLTGISGYTTSESQTQEVNLDSDTILEETAETGECSSLGNSVTDVASSGVNLVLSGASTDMVQSKVAADRLKIVDTQISYLKYIFKFLTQRTGSEQANWC